MVKCNAVDHVFFRKDLIFWCSSNFNVLNVLVIVKYTCDAVAFVLLLHDKKKWFWFLWIPIMTKEHAYTGQPHSNLRFFG